jgi:hypothetical protein
MSQPLVYSNINESDILRLMDMIGEHIHGEEQSDVVAGCIAVALAVSNPKITITQIIDAIQPVSELVALYATDMQAKTTGAQYH